MSEAGKSAAIISRTHWRKSLGTIRGEGPEGGPRGRQGETPTNVNQFAILQITR